MTPIEKAEISRTNGQLSDGPTSAEGKRIVSRNALKHGFASETMAIKSEEQVAYTLTLQGWLNELKPRSMVEETLVERICRNSWKLEKIAEREDEVIDIRFGMADKLDDETITELERELKLLARYEQTAERHFHKALNMFLKLRKNPELLNANLPAPAPVPASRPAPRPAPIPVPRPEPLVIPSVLNKPSLLGDRVSILNVSAVRQRFVNGKTPRAGV